MKRTLMIMVLLILAAGNAWAEGDAVTSATLVRWNSLPTDELTKRADELYKSNTRLDEAMALYSIVANRYDKVKDNNEEAQMSIQAMTRLGMLYFKAIHNYSKAFHWYDKALPLSQQRGMHENEARTLNAIGVAHRSLERASSNTDTVRRSIGYYKQAFDVAVKAKAWDLVALAADNLIAATYADGDIGSIAGQMQTLMSLKELKSNERCQADINLYQTLLALSQRRFDDAMACLDTMRMQTKDDDWNRLTTYYATMAEAYYLQHDYHAALDYREKLRQVILKSDPTNKDYLMQVADLGAQYYAGLGDKMRSLECELESYKLNKEIAEDQGLLSMEQIKMASRLENTVEQLGQLEQKQKQKNQFLAMMGLLAAVLAVMFLMALRFNRRLKADNRKLYEQTVELLKQEDTPKYQSNQLSQNESDKILEQIMDVMRKPEIICKESFSLQDLADAIGSVPRDVSQVINDRCGCNFHTLLSNNRVKEACRRINNADGIENLTIEAIAKEVGIKSRSHFAQVFKRNTGLNPSEYLKIACQRRSE